MSLLWVTAAHETRPLVALSDLHYTNAISDRLADINAKHPKRTMPQVYSDQGALYIDDGHHTVEGAKRRGDTHIRVRHLGDAGGLMVNSHSPEFCPVCGTGPKVVR